MTVINIIIMSNLRIDIKTIDEFIKHNAGIFETNDFNFFEEYVGHVLKESELDRILKITSTQTQRRKRGHYNRYHYYEPQFTLLKNKNFKIQK